MKSVSLLPLEGEVWGWEFSSHQKREENEHGGGCWLWILFRGARALTLTPVVVPGLRPKGGQRSSSAVALAQAGNTREGRGEERGVLHRALRPGRAAGASTGPSARAPLAHEHSQPALCHLIPGFPCPCAPPVALSLRLTTLLCGKTRTAPPLLQLCDVQMFPRPSQCSPAHGTHADGAQTRCLGHWALS